MQPPTHLIGLIDCNNFFASCERVFNSALAKRPVVVLSNNDGCVVSRSPEAKMLGIPMGAPYFQVRDLCERENVAVFSSNFKLYGDMSRRVMAVIDGSVVSMEEYSIDEAFIILPAPEAAAEAAALRGRILQWTGLPVSIGIGPTKTLSKVASDLAKKREGGVLALAEPAEAFEALRDLPVEEVWGIGRRFAARVRGAGITTAGAFVAAPDRVIQRLMGVYGMRIKTELSGIRCRGLEHHEESRKSITSSRSFGGRVYRLAELEQAAAHHAARIAEKLRHDGTAARALSVFVREGKHARGAPYRAAWVEVLDAPTSDSFILIRAALSALGRIYQPGPAYRKVGVTAVSVVPETAVPSATLWGDDGHRARHDLMHAVDAINRRFKARVVAPLASLPGKGARWIAQSERRSPEYTTSWAGLLRVAG